ncbi:MAG TPA: radical SAM protein [bacterium]|nr:radical SAM protein [bacterium]
MNKNIIGNVHSIESFGTLDGPGIRTVIFFQGCPMNCKYCHNVDAVPTDGGTPYTVDALLERILRNKPYWGYDDFPYCKKKNCKGGVTLSGGEPLLQHEFIRELSKKLRCQNIHTAIDTSLYTKKNVITELIDIVDLWMVSIKHTDPIKHKSITGRDNRVILENLRYVDDMISSRELKSEIRIRIVVMPEITDSEQNILELRSIIKKIKSIEAIELLPYGDHGSYKWIESTGDYAYKDIRNANQDDLIRFEKILDLRSVPIIYQK